MKRGRKSTKSVWENRVDYEGEDASGSKGWEHKKKKPLKMEKNLGKTEQMARRKSANTGSLLAAADEYLVSSTRGEMNGYKLTPGD